MPPSELETELPKALVKRIVKTALQESSARDKDYSLSKDALTAFSESAKIFIHYLTATANDICRGAKRQTISSKDVFEALAEMEFSDLTGPLKEAMEAFKESKASKAMVSKKITNSSVAEEEGANEMMGDEAEGDGDEYEEAGDDDSQHGADEEDEVDDEFEEMASEDEAYTENEQGNAKKPRVEDASP